LGLFLLTVFNGMVDLEREWWILPYPASERGDRPRSNRTKSDHSRRAAARMQGGDFGRRWPALVTPGALLWSPPAARLGTVGIRLYYGLTVP
jgi:hypothetical protein